MDCILIHSFQFLTSFESLKFVLLNIIKILIILEKFATLGLLKKVF